MTSFFCSKEQEKMTTSSKKILVDEFCGKQEQDFVSKRAFQNHYRKHLEDDIRCDQCDKTFLNKKRLHWTNDNHNNSRKTAMNALKIFSTNANLRKHEESHKGQVSCEKFSL